MTSKSKNANRAFETEIEKSREESNWKKSIELAQQLKSRAPQYVSLSNFLTGEGKLEQYLEKWPPIQENYERAMKELHEAKGFLILSTNDSGKKAGVALDGYLLLGKLNFACGKFEDALHNYRQAELDTLTEKELPIRSLRIVAESFAIKGLCMEQVINSADPCVTSKYKFSDKDNEMIKAFDLASDLTLLYLQKTNSPHVTAGPILEAALHKVGVLYLKKGNIDKAIDKYRDILNTVESATTGSLRLTAAQRLTELLMSTPSGNVDTTTLVSYTQGAWRPAKYLGINQFVPRNRLEEILLVLMVAEALAVRDAVLSQSHEFEAARVLSVKRAEQVADLLAFVAARWGQLLLLNESLERAMKFSYNDKHIWRQRALTTNSLVTHVPLKYAHTFPASIQNSNAIRAKVVTNHAITLHSTDTTLMLIAVKNYYQMELIEEGLNLSLKALEIEKVEKTQMLSRCYLYVGIGYQMKAKKCNVRTERHSCYEKSLSYLQKATQHDNNDYLSFYYMGLQYALMECYNEAMDATRECLSRYQESACGLRLCAALWTCGRRHQQRALRAVSLAREHYPYCMWLARAHAALHHGEKALEIGKAYLTLMKDCEEQGLNDGCEPDSMSDIPDTQSIKDANSVSIKAWSAVADWSRRTWDRRAPAWLLLAEICLRLGKVSEASDCVSEAANLMPYNHEVMYMRGMVESAANRLDTAKSYFTDALAIRPDHIPSMLQLGITLLQCGAEGAGARCVRGAVHVAEGGARAWGALAGAHTMQGHHSAAADALAVALHQYHTQPMLNIHDLPSHFQ